MTSKIFFFSSPLELRLPSDISRENSRGLGLSRLTSGFKGRNVILGWFERRSVKYWHVSCLAVVRPQSFQRGTRILLGMSRNHS